MKTISRLTYGKIKQQTPSRVLEKSIKLKNEKNKKVRLVDGGKNSPICQAATGNKYINRERNGRIVHKLSC